MRRLLAALALSVLIPLPAPAGEVTVESGDTLSQIAERHGVGLRELMRLNGIENADHVEVGDRLKVPGGGSAAAAAGRVTVQAGDTLSQIAERNGLSVKQLMAMNGIEDADHVEVGQTLSVRGGGSAQGQPNTAFSYEKGAEEHVVRKGESLSAIAKGHDIALERLVALNGIEDPNLVKAGQRLRLSGNPAPAAAETSAAAPAPKPTPRPLAEDTPVAMAKATSTTTWRTYGPMRVDWAQWQPMGGSMVTPGINEAGQPIYLALNCGARKMNATTSEGDWQAWQDPQADFEQKLMSDFCTTQEP
jgi:LysM repeat protein